MSTTDNCGSVVRTGSAKKFVGILSLVVAILCLVSSMALANPSTDTPRAADASIKTGISIVSGAGRHDRGHLQLYGAPLGGGMLFPAVGRERNPAEEERIPLSLIGREGDRTRFLSNLTLGAGRDASGYECKSHMLSMKPVERAAATIFVVEERSSNGELYLALVSLMFPW